MGKVLRQVQYNDENYPDEVLAVHISPDKQGGQCICLRVNDDIIEFKPDDRALLFSAIVLLQRALIEADAGGQHAN